MTSVRKQHIALWTEVYQALEPDTDAVTAAVAMTVKISDAFWDCGGLVCVSAHPLAQNLGLHGREYSAYVIGTLLGSGDFAQRFRAEGYLYRWLDLAARPEPEPDPVPEPQRRYCAICNAEITHKRPEARFCSTRCRVDNHRMLAEARRRRGK